MNSNTSIIFDEEATDAINIIEIKGDGKVLSYIEDISPFEDSIKWNIRKITPGVKRYYINMYWEIYSSNSIRWNDGYGIIFTKIAPNLYKPTTRSYELLKGMKNIKIYQEYIQLMLI